MGSDHAPQPEIDGALAAARDFQVGVILVGQAEKVEPELRRCGWHGNGDRGVELVDAAEVIGMGEPVAVSVRRKKKSSLRIGTRLVNDGRADGFVSAGNTGAAMATAKMVIGHGSSNARAIRNAIRNVKEFSENGASERIERGIAETNAFYKLAGVVG